MADGDGIEKRGDRAAGHRPVEPVQRLLGAGHPEGTDTAQERPGDGPRPAAPAIQTPGGPQPGNGTEGDGGKRDEQQRPERPEGARRAFGNHARPRQSQGPDRGGERLFVWLPGSVMRPFGWLAGCACPGGSGSYPLGNSIAVYHLVKCRTRPDDGELIRFHQNLGDQGRVLYSLAITAP
jgi:hypothetical protein